MGIQISQKPLHKSHLDAAPHQNPRNSANTTSLQSIVDSLDPRTHESPALFPDPILRLGVGVIPWLPAHHQG